MQAAVDAVRDGPTRSDSELAAAYQAVELQLQDPDVVRGLTDDEARQLLVGIDSRRRLVDRQRAIEDWITDWRRHTGP